MSDRPSLVAFLKEPLLGKTSLAKVFWLYGVLGSLLYGAIELFIDPGNELLLRIYVIGGIIFSVYVTAATYKCAANCKSPAVARLGAARPRTGRHRCTSPTTADRAAPGRTR